jgi:hypothetical protein
VVQDGGVQKAGQNGFFLSLLLGFLADALPGGIHINSHNRYSLQTNKIIIRALE